MAGVAADAEGGAVSALLQVRGLVKDFGGFKAVDGVDMDVPEGQIRAVIGPNGAGKSTLFSLLSGHLRPTAGTIRFGDRSLVGRAPHQVARAGIARAFQVTNVFPRMTVLESVQCAVLARRRMVSDFWTFRHRHVTGESRELLAETGLAAFATVEATALSHGDQRALEVTLALATRPRLLLLDEPTAGMSPWETERMVQLVRQLAERHGITVLFSEHDVDLVFAVADLITVMHQGRVLCEGLPAQVRNDPTVNSVYLGEGV